MSLPMTYLPEAENDIDSAYARNEQHMAGLGGQFLDALQEQIKRVGDNPRLYGLFHRDIRAASLKRFPYVVYYRDRGNHILVIAVQHGRRSFRAWRGRA